MPYHHAHCVYDVDFIDIFGLVAYDVVDSSGDVTTMADEQEQLLPMRALRARYHVVDRTIDRWLERKILPAPVRINGLRYWRLSDLEKMERDNMGKREPDAA